MIRRLSVILATTLVAAISAAVHADARASEYGCTVLLCLANPNGPQAVSECVSPIQRLLRDLRAGRGLPTCEEANDGGGTRAQIAQTRYANCPEGTTALASDAYAWLPGEAGEGARLIQGIGEGTDARYGGDEIPTLPAKTCVGQKIGTQSAEVGPSDAAQIVQAGSYDRIVQIPAANATGIDVYINHQFVRQVSLK